MLNRLLFGHHIRVLGIEVEQIRILDLFAHVAARCADDLDHDEPR